MILSQELYLFTLEEALSVTVGKVKGKSHDAGSVFHTLNSSVQLPPAGTLENKPTERYIVASRVNNPFNCCCDAQLTNSGSCLSMGLGE